MIYLLAGRRESGKTTLAYFMARRARSRVLFDPRGLLPPASGRGNGRARTRDEVIDAFDTLAGDPRADVLITPDDDVQGIFVQTCQEIRSFLDEPGIVSGIAGVQTVLDPSLVFLVDELRFVDTRAAAFQWLLRCTTRADVSVLMTCHRPIDVPPDIRAIADVWILFRTTHDADLDLIREHCGAAVADQVRALPPLHFVTWDDTTGKAGVQTTPARWFVPLRNSRQSPDLIPNSQLG